MSDHSLTQRGYIIKRKYLTSDQISELRRELTKTPIILPAFRDFQIPKPFPIYLETTHRFYLPRYYAIAKYGQPSKNHLPVGKSINVTCHAQPRSHQIQPYQKLLAQLREKGGGIFSVYCGWGKTLTAIMAICELRAKTLVVVNKEFLMEQWLDSIHQYTNAKTGILQQNHIPAPDCDIVVAMIHSLAMKNYPEEVLGDFQMVVVDECHHLSSETFSRCLPKIGFRYTLGLSATPYRKDGLSDVFYAYLGEIFHQEKRTGSNLVLVKRFKLTSQSPSYAVQHMSNGVKNTSAMVTALSGFETRNVLILEILSLLVAQDRKILLVSHRREHLDELYKHLQRLDLRKQDGKPASFGYYYGRTGGSKREHKLMLEKSAKCDIILGTFHITSEGLDIPDLDTLFLTTPSNEMEQAVGRILRKYHENRNPWVIDLIDQTGNFPNQAKYRLKYYLGEEYTSQTLGIALPCDSSQLLLPKLFDRFLTQNEVNEIGRDFVKTTKPSNGGSPDPALPLGKCLLDDLPVRSSQKPPIPDQPARPVLPPPKRIFRKRVKMNKSP